MAIYAIDIVKQAEAWIGRKESDNSHREIIDTYNAHKPLARGYKVKYTDAWCATFVSAVAIKCGASAIIPTECGCEEQIKLFKAIGSWIENEDRVPNAGDIIYYDWQDSGTGDNTGHSEHVGIVQKVVGSIIYVIEGNYQNAVGIREIAVNGKNIRGYAAPKYDKKVAEPPKYVVVQPKTELPTAAASTAIRDWQLAAIADGFKFPKYGADNKWGSECESVAVAAIIKKRNGVYKYPNLTKIVQKEVGASIDGKCGINTREAIKRYQKAHGLKVDGAVGLNTWKCILKIK